MLLSEFIPILSPSEVIGLHDVPVIDVNCRPEESNKLTLYGVIDEYLHSSQLTTGRTLLAGIIHQPAAIIAETAEPGLKLPQLIVPDARRAVALAARHLHGHPAQLLTTIGITGTKGKTTTVNLVAQLLTFMKYSCASLGTLGLRLPKQEPIEIGYTTPLATDLYRLLRRTAESGVRAIALEISSHAIALDRTYGLEPNVVVLTNVGRDHLDFHGTVAAYLAVKKRLFQENSCWAVVNGDDELGAEIVASGRPQTISYGFSPHADLAVENIALGINETVLCLRYLGETTTVSCPLIGRFNSENLLAALGTCLALGFPLADLVKHVSMLQAVPGRLEFIPISNNRLGVVDFAHTAESLEQVLTTLRKLTSGHIITVFGCGGDRDQGKRPLMGAVAARLSDLCVVTSDNPRGEHPLRIIDDILVGMPPHGVYVEADRRKAIALAATLAKPGDVILLAGKGHERQQIFSDHIDTFDDKQELERL